MRTAAALVGVLALAGCNTAASQGVQGTGTGNQRSYSVGAFDQVELAGSHDVIVTVGGQPGVRAEGDAAALDRLEIRVDGNRLSIGSRQGLGSWFGSSGHVIVHVTAPALQSAEVAGSGNIRIGGFQSPRFHGGIAGSGNLTLEGVQADEAAFEIAGSGSIQASGRARQSRVEIMGSGDARLAELEAESANISVAGSGNVQLRATGTAAVNIMGSGDVEVTGGARCTISKAGSGDVRCG